MATVEVIVTLKPSLLDAQGKVVQQSLSALGYAGIGDVRIGKVVELTVPDGPDVDAQVHEMCAKLLANPVIEDYRYTVKAGGPDASTDGEQP